MPYNIIHEEDIISRTTYPDYSIRLIYIDGYGDTIDATYNVCYEDVDYVVCADTWDDIEVCLGAR